MMGIPVTNMIRALGEEEKIVHNLSILVPMVDEERKDRKVIS